MENKALSELSLKNDQIAQSIVELEKHKSNLEEQLQSIMDSKSFKLWRKMNIIKKYSLLAIKHPQKVVKNFRLLITKGPVAVYRKIKYQEYTRFQPLSPLNQQYQAWLVKNDIKQKELGQQIIKQHNFKYRPKISIIVPVYNPDKQWLVECINSVLKQTYDNWELCLADDCSTKPYVKKILNKYKKVDNRIKVMYRKENGHISLASNSALSLATGEYIGLLDHDDEISSNALYEVVKVLNNKKSIDFIYSDEDKKEVNGTRVDPYFKPDWSLHQQLSINYTCHFSVFRLSILNSIGGFRVGFEGSQDYDLTLRFIDKINFSNIKHIPKVLYHWRKIDGSTAQETNAKAYAYIAGKRAVKEYISRNKIKGTVKDGIFTGSYRLERELVSKPLVSIIIPTLDKCEYLKPCVLSIINKTNYSNYEIIILDTGSKERKTKEFYKSLIENKNIKIINYPKKEFNFAEANTWTAKKAHGEYLLFLNNDTEVITNEWLTSMMEYAQLQNVGIVGAKLLFPNNTLQHVGVVIGLRGGASHAGVCYPEWELMGHPYLHAKDIVRNVSAITGACLLIKKDLFDKVGGFDKTFKIAFNDIDLCFKVINQGYEIIYTPFAILKHYESITFGRPYDNPNRSNDFFEKEKNIFRNKWKIDSYEDPFYNKNLTLEDESLKLKT